LNKFFADFTRIYRILPVVLQRATLWVFGYVLLQAVLEVGTILSMSFLAMSLAAPDKLLSIPAIAGVLQAFPWLDALRKDPRVFAMFIAAATSILIAAKNCIMAYVSHTTTKLGERIALFAGETIFHNFLYSPYVRHLSGDSSAMFQALSWRGELGRVVIQLMSVYIYATISIAMAITLIFFTPAIILGVIFLMGCIAVGVYRGIRSSIDVAGVESADWRRHETTATLNAMNGIREALIYRQQSVFFDEFRKSCLGGVSPRAFIGLAPAIPTWVLETAGFVVLFTSVAIMYAFLDASMARITGVLTMIMLISWRLLPLFNRSLGALVSVRSARQAALDCLVRVEDALRNPVYAQPEPDLEFLFHKQISFDNVAFRYPNAKTDSLHGITFSIFCGQRIGIVGRSGAGKSSLATLLSGLVEPTCGRFLVDDNELTPAQRSAYCTQIGYVPQNPYILAGTLAENVAFSQWGKPRDPEKVLASCKMAELDIVEQRGIDMPLGQGGGGLSGGQAQRVSIARALYANPSILILDEATSALDTGIERSIMNTIFTLPQTITTVIIAHRLTTVERCDKIIWIDEGRICAMGSPDELLSQYEAFLIKSSS